MDFLARDNIIAEISPIGKGAVSAIRLSGKDSRLISETIFNTKIEKPRMAYFLRSEIDDLVLIYYKAPASYTGEDICEIFCHGNPLIVNNIIDSIVSLKEYKVRLAQPGEFTKRAYLNNKMDLIQAESVADIINSSSEISIKLRNKVLKGELSNKINKIKEELLSISGLAELEIDFEEEKAGVFDSRKTKTQIKDIIDDVDLMIDSSSQIERATKDITVAIVGDTNVGKSSLFNSLIGKQRSIVHHVPGTTRDYIESVVSMDGFNILFIDTAGFRTDTECQVELEGIKRTIDLGDAAFFVIEVFDADNYVFKYEKSLKVRNKVDIKKPEKQIDEVIYISAKTGEGLKELKENIIRTLVYDLGLDDKRTHEFMLSKRQNLLLKKLKEELCQIIQSIDLGAYVDAVSYLLRQAVLLINDLLGKEQNNDETIEDVFSKFCIGK